MLSRVPRLARLRELWPRRKLGPGLLRYVQRPERVRTGTCVEPLRGGGEAYPAMLAAIAGARKRIQFEMYIFRDDDVGRRFRDAFLERANAGVEVRLLFDALGSFSLTEEFLEPLRAAGARVRFFHPVAPWRPRWGWNKRDHKKILVIDECVAFTGGINVGVEYLPLEAGGGGWLDWHARVEGPAATDLAASFRKTWIDAGGDAYEPLPACVDSTRRCSLGVQVVPNDSVRTRWAMHRAYRFAIARAHRDISIMNAYFIPERRLRRAFRHAVGRGVSVRVVVPSNSDVKAVRHASRRLYPTLIESGVRVFEWPETMMHAKVGVIDGVWSSIGSANLNHRSVLHNHEIGLVCVDEELAGVLQREFESDIQRCREVTLADLAKLSWWERAQDWFWFQLRSWL